MPKNDYWRIFTLRNKVCKIDPSSLSSSNDILLQKMLFLDPRNTRKTDFILSNIMTIFVKEFL